MDQNHWGGTELGWEDDKTFPLIPWDISGYLSNRSVEGI